MIRQAWLLIILAWPWAIAADDAPSSTLQRIEQAIQKLGDETVPLSLSCHDLKEVLKLSAAYDGSLYQEIHRLLNQEQTRHYLSQRRLLDLGHQLAMWRRDHQAITKFTEQRGALNLALVLSGLGDWHDLNLERQQVMVSDFFSKPSRTLITVDGRPRQVKVLKSLNGDTHLNSHHHEAFHQGGAALLFQFELTDAQGGYLAIKGCPRFRFQINGQASQMLSLSLHDSHPSVHSFWPVAFRQGANQLLLEIPSAQSKIEVVLLDQDGQILKPLSQSSDRPTSALKASPHIPPAPYPFEHETGAKRWSGHDQARLCLLNRHHNLALKLALALKEQSPDDPQTWILLHDTLLKAESILDSSSQQKQSRQALDQALKLDPKLYRACLSKAHWLRQEKRFKEAWDYLDSLLDHRPKDLEILTLKTLICDDLSMTWEYAGLLEQSHQADPHSALFYHLKSQDLYARDRHQELAEHEFRRWTIRAQPDRDLLTRLLNSGFHQAAQDIAAFLSRYHLSDKEQRRQDIEKPLVASQTHQAYQLIREALHREPHAPDLHLMAFENAFRLDDLSMALHHITQMLALWPSLKSVADIKGRLQTKDSDHDLFKSKQRDLSDLKYKGEAWLDRRSEALGLWRQRVVRIFADGGQAIQDHSLSEVLKPEGAMALSRVPAEGVILCQTHTADEKGAVILPSSRPYESGGDYTMPRLKVGARTEVIRRFHQGGHHKHRLEAQHFFFREPEETLIPLKDGQLILIYPKAMPLHIEVHNAPGLKRQRQIIRHEGEELIEERFDIQHLPLLASEPQSPDFEKLLPLIIYGTPPEAKPHSLRNARFTEARSQNTVVIEEFLKNIVDPTTMTRQEQVEQIARKACQRLLPQEQSGTASQQLSAGRGHRLLLCQALLNAAGIPVQCLLLERRSLGAFQSSFFDTGPEHFIPVLHLPASGQDEALWIVDPYPVAPLNQLPLYFNDCRAYLSGHHPLQEVPLPSVPDESEDEGYLLELQLDESGHAKGRLFLRQAGARGCRLSESLDQLSEEQLTISVSHLLHQLWTGAHPTQKHQAAWKDEALLMGCDWQYDHFLHKSNPQQNTWRSPRLLRPLNLLEKLGERPQRAFPLIQDSRLSFYDESIIHTGAWTPQNKLPQFQKEAFGIHYKLESQWLAEEKTLRITRRCVLSPTEIPALDYQSFLKMLRELDDMDRYELDFVLP